MKIPALVGKKTLITSSKIQTPPSHLGPFVVILKKNEISSARTGIIIQKSLLNWLLIEIILKENLERLYEDLS